MEKKWEEMSPDQRMEARFNTWMVPRKIKFASPEAKASYEARVTRLKDAIRLQKTPDRIPVFPLYTFLPAHLAGITAEEAMYDYDKLVSSWMHYLTEYEPDAYFTPAMASAGRPLEILEYKLFKWAGHGVPSNSTYQYVEEEYMRADEYEAFIEDPSDFFMRTYLPRVIGRLEPLKRLRPLTDIIGMPSLALNLIQYGNPEVQKAMEAVLEAGREAARWVKYIGAFQKEATEKGFANGSGGGTVAPFDMIGDTLRGSHGIIMDMFRQPDILLQALEKITPIIIKQGVAGANATGNPLVFMPLHKGADGFMSDEQFRTFYWPSLKKVLMELIKEGCIPLVFAEGGFNSRLEYLKELPKGVSVWIFDQTDMARAKELLGDNICISGNVPASLLISADVKKMEDYCKMLIEVAGKNGGFIMGCGTALDEAKPENFRAMFQYTRKNGIYQ